MKLLTLCSIVLLTLQPLSTLYIGCSVDERVQDYQRDA